MSAIYQVGCWKSIPSNLTISLLFMFLGAFFSFFSSLSPTFFIICCLEDIFLNVVCRRELLNEYCGEISRSVSGE